MLEDFDLGQQIAEEGKRHVDVRKLAEIIEHRVDFNRFDYEAGETDMIVAFLTVIAGYIDAGGVIDVSDDVAAERRAWEADMKDMAQIKREWYDYRHEGDETPPWRRQS